MVCPSTYHNYINPNTPCPLLHTTELANKIIIHNFTGWCCTSLHANKLQRLVPRRIVIDIQCRQGGLNIAIEAIVSVCGEIEVMRVEFLEFDASIGLRLRQGTDGQGATTTATATKEGGGHYYLLDTD